MYSMGVTSDGPALLCASFYAEPHDILPVLGTCTEAIPVSRTSEFHLSKFILGDMAPRLFASRLHHASKSDASSPKAENAGFDTVR